MARLRAKRGKKGTNAQTVRERERPTGLFPWQQELPDSRAASDHRERGEPGRSPSQSTRASTRPEGRETAAHSSEPCCGRAKDTLAFPHGHVSWEATDAQTSLASLHLSHSSWEHLTGDRTTQDSVCFNRSETGGAVGTQQRSFLEEGAGP